jgi:hypothetical protein
MSFYKLTIPEVTKGEENIISSTVSAMQDLVPVDVVALYLGFKALLTDDIAKLALPLVAIILTIFLRWTRTDKKDLYAEKGRTRWGMILIPVLALIGWIYISGDSILGLTVASTQLIALVFAALNIMLPPVYRERLKASMEKKQDKDSKAIV